MLTNLFVCGPVFAALLAIAHHDSRYGLVADDTLYLNVFGDGSGSNNWANLRIDPDDEMSVFNLGSYSSGAYFSLDGRSFRVNS